MTFFELIRASLLADSAENRPPGKLATAQATSIAVAFLCFEGLRNIETTPMAIPLLPWG